MDKNKKDLNGKNKKWHSLEIHQVFEKLSTSKDGLNSEEASERKKKYGDNKLPDQKRVSIFQIILRQLLNPLIFVLIVAAIASVAIGEGKDAIFIFLVIFINSLLGTYQEYKAEKSAASLQSLLKIKAHIKRNGKEIQVPSEELVPGDVVFLESGVKVPADIRLFEANNLSIDESLLTGESLAVLKELTVLKNKLAVSERRNMAHAGSRVMTGRGTGVVVETGLRTQVGKIATNVKESVGAKPPLVLRMERFIKQISIFIIAISIVLGVILRYGGMDYATIFFFVVALAVSAIPEGLPIALTVALSIASKRMAKRNVIVRKLTAVESLGSCTVIASDKTGTLTVNEQTIKKIVLPDGSSFSVSGEGYNGMGKITDDKNPDKGLELQHDDPVHFLNTIAVIANEGKLVQKESDWEHLGDAMDVALLGMSYKMGINPEDLRSSHPIISTIPYESANKYSAAFWQTGSQITCGVKGSAETLLDFCSSMIIGNTTKELDKEKILKQAEDLANEGYRVLGFAGRNYPSEQTPSEHTDLSELVFYGLVCFIDPLRADARDAVDQCKDAGIKVIMITGDHPATASAISQNLGILDKGQKVVTGSMLREAGSTDSEEFIKLVTTTTVFARVSPTQKLEIVDVLIKSGEFVAVTGDGVNDAPALKRANIGVAMGSGTDVAKEVGSMIVVDDNFSSIVSGVEQGRFAYDNVRKVILLLISTGGGLIILIVAALLGGFPLPLLAVQLLWLNLVTNGIQDVALAFEGGEPGAMKKKPRHPSEKIFNPLMLKQTLLAASTMGVISFALWVRLINYQHMEEEPARNIILLLVVFMQNLHAFNSRSETISTFKIPWNRNYLLVFGVLVAQGIHNLSMQIPIMQSVLRVQPISPSQWLQVLVLAIPVLLVMEIFKFVNKRTRRN